MLQSLFSVEDPSEDYQRVRDFVDVKNCLNLDSYTAENISSGFTKALVKETQEKLKINKVGNWHDVGVLRKVIQSCHIVLCVCLELCSLPDFSIL